MMKLNTDVRLVQKHPMVVEMNLSILIMSIPSPPVLAVEARKGQNIAMVIETNAYNTVLI